MLDCRHGRILLGCRWYDEGEEDDEEEEADEQLEEEEDDIEEDGEGEEADKEEETNYPSKMRILDILRVICLICLGSDSVTHGQ